MTFTMKLKEEITKKEYNIIEKKIELISYLRYSAKIDKKIMITTENASIARRLYKSIKEIYKINPKVIIRIEKRFKKKQVYILEFLNNIEIKEDLKDKLDFNDDEEIIAYIEGAFLGVGTITDPSTNGYHLEFVFKTEKDAKYLNKLLIHFDIIAKIVVRKGKYVLYVKNVDNISDLLKMFKATTSLFYFEDIRIYRDHKNMVNRLNNCEISNQEKTTKTGLDQIEAIKYLEENDLIDLLDDNAKIVLKYRSMYPDSSYSDLASIISLETDYKVGKSGINHNFIKIKKLIERHKK